MKLPLERHNIEGLFDIDGKSEDQAIVCLDNDVEELEKAYEECKQRYDEVLKKLKDREETSITWCVQDFIDRAFELESEEDDYEELEESHDNMSIEYARKHLKKYDPDKFEDALYNMIRHYDAEIGITWDTVDCYLEDCLKDK